MRRCTRYLCFLLLAGLLVGCGKREIALTFRNATDHDLEVSLRGPGKPTGLLGAAPAQGQLTRTLIVLREELPASYIWRAGDYHGAFTLFTRGDDNQTIDIAQGQRE